MNAEPPFSLAVGFLRIKYIFSRIVYKAQINGKPLFEQNLKLLYISHDLRPRKGIQGSVHNNAVVLSLSLPLHLH